LEKPDKYLLKKCHIPDEVFEMRVAIIHDWLVVYGGAERVLEQMLQVFPDADIFTLIDFLPSQDRGFLHGKRVQTSFLQKLPFARR
jgi:hypothetical protein